jgi:hypothetical protein
MGRPSQIGLPKRRCSARTASGRPCQNWARAGHDTCRSHAVGEKVGRPSSLTPEIQKTIVAAIRAGSYNEAACRAVGISETSFYRWMEVGEADRERGVESAYADFWEAVTRASAQAEVHAVGLIRQAMPDDWRAAAHYLERRFPRRWGRRDSVELGGELAIRSFSEIAKAAEEFLAEEVG